MCRLVDECIYPAATKRGLVVPLGGSVRKTEVLHIKYHHELGLDKDSRLTLTLILTPTTTLALTLTVIGDLR